MIEKLTGGIPILYISDGKLTAPISETVNLANKLNEVIEAVNNLTAKPVEAPKKPKFGEWVLTKETVPPVGKKVLACLDNGNFIFFENQRCYLVNAIKMPAWTPLPEPYKGGADNG
jgi:hypothetical protein